MKSVRKGVFETNSSSTHSLTITAKTDYDRWVNGEMLYNRWNDILVEITTETENDEDCYSYSRYQDEIGGYYETYTENYTSKSGDEIVAFGYHGADY